MMGTAHALLTALPSILCRAAKEQSQNTPGGFYQWLYGWTGTGEVTV